MPNLAISRSKLYRKNDNRFVEENNSSLIRAYTGPARFDSAAQLNTLRELEYLLWLYYNCFLPCMRLKDKLVSLDGRLRKPMIPLRLHLIVFWLLIPLTNSS